MTTSPSKEAYHPFPKGGCTHRLLLGCAALLAGPARRRRDVLRLLELGNSTEALVTLVPDLHSPKLVHTKNGKLGELWEGGLTA